MNAAKLMKLLREAQARVSDLESQLSAVPAPAPPVERIVHVDRPVYLPSVETQIIEIEKVVYQDNPEHLATIQALQERLCQFTSQSDS